MTLSFYTNDVHTSIPFLMLPPRISHSTNCTTFYVELSCDHQDANSYSNFSLPHLPWRFVRNNSRRQLASSAPRLSSSSLNVWCQTDKDVNLCFLCSAAFRGNERAEWCESVVMWIYGTCTSLSRASWSSITVRGLTWRLIRISHPYKPLVDIKPLLLLSILPCQSRAYVQII